MALTILRQQIAPAPSPARFGIPAQGQFTDTVRLAQIFHQGHVRVGCDAVRWQGETTLRARAREKEQRRQHAAARLNRACSAWYKLDLAFEAKKVSIHAVLRGIRERPGEISGLGTRCMLAQRRVAQEVARILLWLFVFGAHWTVALAQSDMHRAVTDGAYEMFRKKVEKDKAASDSAVRPAIANGVAKAQGLLKGKRFQESLAQVALLDGVPNKSEEETELLESTRGTAAVGLGDTDLAVRSFSVLMGLPSLPAQFKQATAQTLANLMWQNKRYPESAAWVERYFAEGGSDPALRVLLAKSFYLAALYDKAAAAMQAVVQQADEAGQSVPKDQLEMLASSHAQTKNERGYVEALERLVRAYPTPAYWADLLAREVNRADFDDRLRWSAYELQVATQSMAKEDHFYMAELAAQQGYWVIARNILARHPLVRTDHDATFLAEYDRMQRVAQSRAPKMLEELSQLQTQAVAAGDGVRLFRVGATRIELGDTEQGLALMERAVKMGGASAGDEYALRLAAAYAFANQRERALAVLKRVRENSTAAHLARLWAMFLRPQTTAAP